MKKIIFSIIAIALVSCINLFAQAPLYRVEPGDTFESISKEFGVTVDALRNANPNAKVLYVGMKIKIPEIVEYTSQVKPSIDKHVAENNPVVKEEYNHSLEEPYTLSDNITEQNKDEHDTDSDLDLDETTGVCSRVGGGMMFNEGEMVKNAFFIEYYLGARSYVFDPMFIEYGLGYTLENSWANEKNYKYDSMSHSLSLPLLAGVSLGEAANIYMGPYLDFTMASKTEMDIYGEKSVTRLRDIEDYNRFMLGLKFGGEVGFEGFKIGVCYSLGLTSHMKGNKASGGQLLIYLGF